MTTTQTVSALSLGGDKYRGAVVEVLTRLLASRALLICQIGSAASPAFSLPWNVPISRAIELAYDRDFSHLPVLDRNRKPLGYIDVARLKEKWEAGRASPDDKIADYMTKFKRTASIPYTLIAPLSPLADLEEFLKSHEFALVTDPDRKFVLGVATSQDLQNFVIRRGS